MRLCNDTVTVFSYAVSATTHAPTYTAHVIEGVSWYATAAETVDPKGGLVAAHKVTVRIPAAAVPSGVTFTSKDIVVKGDASTATATPAALKAVYGDDCATVLAVTDNRRAPNAPHIRLTCA